ncbi:MAG: hypothetical protein WAW42_12870 [Candidatus Competibacteraceae bacterium]
MAHVGYFCPTLPDESWTRLRDILAVPNAEPGDPRLTEYRQLLESRLALLPRHIHPPH